MNFKFFEIGSDRWTKDIDLLEAYRLSERKEDPKNKKMLFIIFIEIVAMVLIMIFMKGSIYFRQRKIDRLKAEIDTYKTQIKEVDDFNMMKNLCAKKQETYDFISSENQNMIAFLETVENILPESVAIDSLEIGDESVSFLVSASNEESIAQLLSNMQSSGHFSDISISGITTSDNNKKSSITAKVKGLNENARVDDKRGSE